ncbi:DUF397 domain-containing protein [Streptomyces sp. GSL17-111]|uniref:DUF397 domain-containing protein n=1 Tax=Streptomyces sp. GSL17-111 TaxID=3121596 RepID=UPI0030F3B1C5
MNHNRDVHAVSLSAAAWRKSSYSANGGECVEVADLPGGLAVRDSKDVVVPGFRTRADAWNAFVQAVSANRL